MEATYFSMNRSGEVELSLLFYNLELEVPRIIPFKFKVETIVCTSCPFNISTKLIPTKAL